MTAFQIKDPALKRKIYWLLFSLLLLAVLVFLGNHDFRLYKQTIVEVTSVETSFFKSETGPNLETENYYTQTLETVVKNGKYEGTEVTIENEYAASGIKEEQYDKGDCLFVDLSKSDGSFSTTITGVKRDVYLCLLAGILVLSLIFVSSRQGLLTIASIIVNTALFVAWIALNGTSIYDPQNWVLLVIGFCTITLVLVSGFHKKTAAAILASLLCVAAIYGIYQLTAAHTAKLPFELVEYLTGPESAEPVFVISVIVGSLGAILDVAITICSSVNEMVRTTKGLSLRALIHSIREIAMDIMGTMINVLFFSYLSGTVFMIVLELKNGYSFTSLLQFSFIFEVVRFLIGSIGIVLAIPLATLIAVVFFKKEMGVAVK